MGHRGSWCAFLVVAHSLFRSATNSGAHGAHGATVSHMNPRPYMVANALEDEAPRTFSGEYFELLGPETSSRYSEVSWESQPVRLPDDIISRFDNKVMAVTGYEVDIVRTSFNKTTSAPCTELYNHHYSGWMSGKAASIADQHGSDDNPVEPITMGPHGTPLPSWTLDRTGAVVPFPHVQAFSEGNGNEHRGSFRGYAKGFAQMIHSPVTWANNPMIINTNKRVTTDTSPGPINHVLVPRHSLAPPDSDYSGLLECPCTTRKVKVVEGYRVGDRACVDGDSSAAISTALECGVAAARAGLTPTISHDPVVVANSSSAAPLGCSASFVPPSTLHHPDHPLGGWRITFHAGANAAQLEQCGGDGGARGVGGVVDTGGTVGVALSVSLRPPADTGSGAGDGGEATIVLQGPSNSTWFGVAFNATAMSTEPYAIIVDGAGVVTERRLGNHAAGEPLATSVMVVSHSVDAAAARRTVVLRRPLQGRTPAHFSFDATVPGALPVLAARGQWHHAALGFHGPSRTSLALTLAPVAASKRDTTNGDAGLGSVCICRDPAANAGTIDGIAFNPNVCAPAPESQLIDTHNAICNITAYNGGLYCCHDKTFLLDADQVIPPTEDTWRIKYRFYFEEYSATGGVATHRNLFRMWWSTEATNNEYDVPKSRADCRSPQTPAADCVHTLESKFQGRDMVAGAHGGGGSQCMVSGDPSACGNASLIAERDGGEFLLMYAAAHCHTPACMSLELWDDDRGVLLCRNAPTYGAGEGPVHDEKAYVVAIPPCVWGSPTEGLRPPPVLRLDSNLTTIKRANNTNGHWGVMALWQMRGAYVGGDPWAPLP